MRGVRQLRRQRGGDEETSGPSGKSRKSASSRVDAARQYLAKYVDPLMSEIINYLLVEQPRDARAAILKYLEARRIGQPPSPGPTRASTAPQDARNAVMRDRLYMARKVTCVFATHSSSGVCT